MKIRKRLNEQQAEQLNLEIKPKTDRRNPRYTITQEQYNELLENKVESETTSNTYEKPFVLSAWNDKGYMMDIDEYCNHYKLPRKDVKSYKLVSHTGTPFYNIVFKENTEITNTIDYSFIEGIVKKHIKPIKRKVKSNIPSKTNTFDRLIYADTHIGMTPNENGFALYGGKWDEEVLNKRLDELCLFVENKQESDRLVIDDLGDFLDGWDGETTRRGHKLPQNMDNETAFDVGLSFKIKMVDILINFYDKIIINNICEDNHSGSFGYILNSAFKRFIEQKYSNVSVINHRKFINHYFMGKHCFVISHGKDSKSLKFGFKPVLDSKQIEKIDQYIKQNEIYKQCDFIEFSKGDSHQLILDYATSDDFDYCNYLAFSPSSEWVQTNFKKGRSGFVFSNVDYNDNLKDIKTYYFK